MSTANRPGAHGENCRTRRELPAAHSAGGSAGIGAHHVIRRVRVTYGTRTDAASGGTSVAFHMTQHIQTPTTEP